MVDVPKKALQDISDELRDLKNWLAVIQEEYDLEEKDCKQLTKSVNKIGRLLRS